MDSDSPLSNHNPAIHGSGPARSTAAPGRAATLDRYVLKRLYAKYKERKLGPIAAERLTEPLHLNLLSVFVALFGSFRAKVNFDLIVRQQNAFPMLHAANKAREAGLKRVSVVEFGVANGAGLVNMCKIAASVEKETGIGFDLYGFDTGKGLPSPGDYRDHPEEFQGGDFPMDCDRLRRALPPNAHLLIGDVGETIPSFLARLSPKAPLAYVSLDFVYYSSSSRALELFKGDPRKYLPMITLYLDDIGIEASNPWCGELLAVNEFNQENALRKIAPFTMLRARRLFKNASWIDKTHVVHVLDHPMRSAGAAKRDAHAVIKNEYIA
jgi:hypothetical protein